MPSTVPPRSADAAFPAGVPLRATTIGSGATAQGSNSVALGERAIYVREAAGPIVSGDNNVVLTGMQGEAIQAALQAALAQLVAAENRPAAETLFRIATQPGEVADLLFADPPADALAPTEIPYHATLRQGIEDTTAFLANQVGQVLLVAGGSGQGKSRELAELAARLCGRAGWTVCVARITTSGRMGVPTGRLPHKKLLFLVDDLERHQGQTGAGEYLRQLHACLDFFNRDPDTDVRLIVTARPDADLGWDWSQPLWRRLQTVSLPPCSAEALQGFLQTVADLAGVPVEAETVPALLEHSDGTPKTIVENVRRMRQQGQPLTLANWRASWRALWEERFRAVYHKRAAIEPLYEALHLLRAVGLPLRRPYVLRLGAALGPGDVDAALVLACDRRLLNCRADRIEPYGDEQLEVGLRSIGRELPALADHHARLVPVLLAVAPDQPGGLDDLTDLAAHLLHHDQYADVVRVATVILQHEANHVAALRQRALAHIGLKAYRAADRDLSRAIEAAPDEAGLFVLRAVTRISLRTYAEADADLTRALALTETAQLYGLRGLLRLLQSQGQEAVADFSTALTMDEPSNDLYLFRAFARSETGEIDAAIEDLTHLIEIGRTEGQIHFLRGWLYYRQADYEAAVADLTVALADTPTTYFYLLRGMANFFLGQLEPAAADFSAAIERESREQDTFLAFLGELVTRFDEQSPEELAQWLATKWAAFPQLFPGLAAEVEAAGDTLAVGTFLYDWFRRLFVGKPNKLDPDVVRLVLPTLPYLMRGWVRLAQGQQEAAQGDLEEALRRGTDAAFAGLLLGVALTKQGKLDEADAAFSASIDAGQRHPWAYFGRGCIRHDRGDFEGAARDLTRAAEGGMEQATLWALRGHARLQLGDAAGAQADAETALAADPDNALAHYTRAVLLARAGQLPEALAAYNATLAAGMDQPMVYLERGQVHLVAGAYAEAEADAEVAIEAGVASIQAHTLRGYARLKQGEFAAAEADFDQALADEHLPALVGRASARFNQGKHEAAEADFTAAIESGFTDSAIFYDRGLARLQQGHLLPAHADFDRAIAGNPQDPDTYVQRGQTHLLLGDPEAALRDLERALALGREEGGAVAWRIGALFFSGRWRETVEVCSGLIPQHPELAFPYQFRSMAHTRLNELEAAHRDAQRSLALEPTDRTTLHALGDWQLAQGQVEVALTFYRVALDVAETADSHFRLGIVYLLQGQREQARAAYERGAQLAQPIDRVWARRDLDHWLAQQGDNAVDASWLQTIYALLDPA